jgi:hypothetical protein
MKFTLDLGTGPDRATVIRLSAGFPDGAATRAFASIKFPKMRQLRLQKSSSRKNLYTHADSGTCDANTRRERNQARALSEWNDDSTGANTEIAPGRLAAVGFASFRVGDPCHISVHRQSLCSCLTGKNSNSDVNNFLIGPCLTSDAPSRIHPQQAAYSIRLTQARRRHRLELRSPLAQALVIQGVHYGEW